MVCHAVEAFDKQDAALSLHSGRYYHGRRREFHVTPVPSGLVAWIELTALTLDRYERGMTLYTHEGTVSFGLGRFSLFNLGNWKAPLFLTFEPDAPLDRLQVQPADDFLSLEENLPAGEVITADSEKRELLGQGRNRSHRPWLLSAPASGSTRSRPVPSGIREGPLRHPIPRRLGIKIPPSSGEGVAELKMFDRRHNGHSSANGTQRDGPGIPGKRR